MIDLLPFSGPDWSAFQGVEKPDESEPLIGSAQVMGPGWTDEDLQHLAAVVVDRRRVGVNAAESLWELECPYDMGVVLARHLDEPIRTEQLRRWGFVQIA